MFFTVTMSQLRCNQFKMVQRTANIMAMLANACVQNKKLHDTLLCE